VVNRLADDVLGGIPGGEYRIVTGCAYMILVEGAQQFSILKFPDFSLTFPCPILISSDIFAQTIYGNARKCTRVHYFKSLVLRATKKVKID